MSGQDRAPRITYLEDDPEVAKSTAIQEVGASASSALHVPVLLVVSGSFSVGRVAEARPYAVIGRAADSDLVLQEEGVSRRHARITVDPQGTLWIEDLGSANGVIVDGARVKHHRLVDGQRIGIGNATLLFLHMDGSRNALWKNMRSAASEDNEVRALRRHAFVEATELAQIAAGRSAPPSVGLITLTNAAAIAANGGAPAINATLRKVVHLARHLLRRDGLVVGRMSRGTIAALLPSSPLPDAKEGLALVCKAIEWDDAPVKSEPAPILRGRCFSLLRGSDRLERELLDAEAEGER